MLSRDHPLRGFVLHRHGALYVPCAVSHAAIVLEGPAGHCRVSFRDFLSTHPEALSALQSTLSEAQLGRLQSLMSTPVTPQRQDAHSSGGHPPAETAPPATAQPRSPAPHSLLEALRTLQGVQGGALGWDETGLKLLRGSPAQLHGDPVPLRQILEQAPHFACEALISLLPYPFAETMWEAAWLGRPRAPHKPSWAGAIRRFTPSRVLEFHSGGVRCAQPTATLSYPELLERDVQLFLHYDERLEHSTQIARELLEVWSHEAFGMRTARVTLRYLKNNTRQYNIGFKALRAALGLEEATLRFSKVMIPPETARGGTHRPAALQVRSEPSFASRGEVQLSPAQQARRERDAALLALRTTRLPPPAAHPALPAPPRYAPPRHEFAPHFHFCIQDLPQGHALERHGRGVLLLKVPHGTIEVLEFSAADVFVKASSGATVRLHMLSADALERAWRAYAVYLRVLESTEPRASWVLRDAQGPLRHFVAPEAQARWELVCYAFNTADRIPLEQLERLPMRVKRASEVFSVGLAEQPTDPTLDAHPSERATYRGGDPRLLRESPGSRYGSYPSFEGDDEDD